MKTIRKIIKRLQVQTLVCTAVLFAWTQSPASEIDELEKAASKGDAKAQFLLGQKYASGEGVPKDAAKGFEWAQKSAAQGNSDGQWVLGAMYFERAIDLNSSDNREDRGKALKDSREAFKWLEKAALQGQAEAQAQLSAMYTFGWCVPHDIVRSYAWISVAVENCTDKRARIDLAQTRDMMEKNELTAKQIAAGKKLSAEIMKKLPKKKGE